MTPVEPVIRETDSRLISLTFAKNQPEYMPLPAVVSGYGRVTTRWRLTWRERLRLLLRGDLWLQVLTFNHPLQPIKLLTEEPGVEECL